MPIINRERTVDGWTITTELPDHSLTFVYTKVDGGRWLWNGQPIDLVAYHHKSLRAMLEEAIK